MELTSPHREAPDELSAVEALHSEGCTDGLPVIVPTPQRVEAILAATGLDPDFVLGEVGPSYGVATAEKVAIAAVMAGCLADHMPVVVAAVKAICDPAFDLAEMQSTTHCTAPLLIVNGPARQICGGIAGGFGALGPGHRANASIGRAVRLVMMNVGGARPGTSDMALLGHPGKFTFCLAEDEEGSPFPPLHTSLGRGYTADHSVVTVVGAEGPHSVLHVGDADDPTSPARLLDSLAGVIANVGSNNAWFGRGAVAVALNPDHAEILARGGYDRAAVQRELSQRATNPLGLLRRLNPSFAPDAHGERPSEQDEPRRAVRDPADVLVFQAGGSGLYSMVMPSWGAGPHANPWVCAEIDVADACEVPWAAAATYESRPALQRLAH